VAPVKGEVKELLKHKFLDVDLPYELRVTEAALTEFIRHAFSAMQTATGLPGQAPGHHPMNYTVSESQRCNCFPGASDPGAAHPTPARNMQLCALV